MRIVFVFLGMLALPVLAGPPSLTPAAAIALQTDPAKLAKLTQPRAANPRMQRCIYWLATAEAEGDDPGAVLDAAAKINGTAGTPYAGFLKWGMLENLKLAHEYGILNPEGMAAMRTGNSAKITKGESTGDVAAADHVIPRAICPKLDNQVMNLELRPLRKIEVKSDKITDRAKAFAKELYEAKLLSEEGWKAVDKGN